MSEHEYTENMLWNFVDGNLSEQQKKHLLRQCAVNKALADKLQEIKSAHSQLKHLMEGSITPGPPLTKAVISEINKFEMAKMESDKRFDSGVIIATFLILIGCLCVPFYYCITNEAYKDSLLAIVNNDFFLNCILVVLTFIASLFVSSRIRLSLLKEGLMRNF
ncbi:hypothetical protein QE382_003214 [Sphingobacterium zeae]|uniref:Zinc-finger n=1 Tax=Sphingobacterium zeae TaxID=1776859 RepID=A0ABU0U8D8_9SPHI|nr:hypothetical protein [Sphingobacterium zeae]MDQ1151230.1 hypothetical protein [Sphingobacterium zeae]